MKSIHKIAVACVVPLAFSMAAIPAVAANDRGSDKEAEAMVGKAVALIKSAGPDKAYKILTDHPDGAFKDRDLYVFVYDFDGTCLAQGANSRMVGKNLIGIKDVEGIPFIQKEIEMVKAQKKGWFGPYKFPNAATGAVEVKKSYCEQGVGNTMVCVGVYKAE
jgi:signal transduction histidine kinase